MRAILEEWRSPRRLAEVELRQVERKMKHFRHAVCSME